MRYENETFLFNVYSFLYEISKFLDPQSVIDALALAIEEGFMKRNVRFVREIISLLEAQGHDCTDANGKLIAMVF